MRRVNYVLWIIIVVLAGCGSRIEPAQMLIQKQEWVTVLAEAEELRIAELANGLEQYIGFWHCEELILPMTIGQDSMRSQLGIELEGTVLEVCSDYSVLLDGKKFVLSNVEIRDYSWYLDAFRSGPFFAQGIVVEFALESVESQEKFSICIAENGMYLFSYAYGFYSVHKQENTDIEDREVETEVIKLLREAYQERYDDASAQMERIVGTWSGGKYIFSEDGDVKIDGNYTLRIDNDEDDLVKVFFDNNLLKINLKEIVSIGDYTEENYLKTLNISEKCENLVINRESIVIRMQCEEEPMIIVVSKYDFENCDREIKMKLYIDEEVYYLTKG